MTNNQFPLIPPTYEQYVIPTIEEIKDKKAFLPIEFKRQLLNSQAKFNNNTKVHCAFIDCPWSNSFQIEIYLQNFGNSRRWARESGQGTSLPGYWKTSPTGKYYWRKDLWLTDIGQAQNVIPLLTNDKVYTVNYTGLHCKEDNKFCNDALDIINKAIEWHKLGGAIEISETIDSEVYRINKFLIKIAGTTISNIVLSPLGPFAPLLGGYSWIMSEIAKNDCFDKDAKLFWEQMSGVSEGIFWENWENIFIPLAAKKTGYQIAKEIIVHKKRTINFTKFLINTGKVLKQVDELRIIDTPLWKIIKHNSHLEEGKIYNSGCKICEDGIYETIHEIMEIIVDND